MRITNTMIRRNYQSNLNQSLGALNTSRTQMETGRKYSQSYMEPIDSSRASVLENRYARNADYKNSVEDSMKFQDVQEGVVMEINKITTEISKKYGMEAVSDTSASVRESYAETFRAMQESMVFSLNTKYGDVYAMGGADAANPPFQIEDDGTVTFRGLDVNDTANFTQLEEFAKESTYVDLGFGMEFDATGKVVPSSAFNAAYPGINVVGFGNTAEGQSENVIVLLGEMADVLEAEPFDRGAYEDLWMQFEEGSKHVKDCFTEIGTKSALLTATKERLEEEELSIIKSFDEKVNIEATEAILNFTYDNYIHSAVLKMGTNILTNSLLDFLR